MSFPSTEICKLIGISPLHSHIWVSAVCLRKQEWSVGEGDPIMGPGQHAKTWGDGDSLLRRRSSTVPLAPTPPWTAAPAVRLLMTRVVGSRDLTMRLPEGLIWFEILGPSETDVSPYQSYQSVLEKLKHECIYAVYKLLRMQSLHWTFAFTVPICLPLSLCPCILITQRVCCSDSQWAVTAHWTSKTRWNMWGQQHGQ